MFLWMVMAESPRKMEQFNECMQSFIHSRDSFLALARKMSAKERLDSSHSSATENEVSEKKSTYVSLRFWSLSHAIQCLWLHIQGCEPYPQQRQTTAIIRGMERWVSG